MRDDDLYASTYDYHEDVGYLWNHSCDPNTWFVNDALVGGCDGSGGRDMGYHPLFLPCYQIKTHTISYSHTLLPLYSGGSTS